MSNNSEQVERIVGDNPGSASPGPGTGRSDAVNSSKTPVQDARTSKPGSNAGASSGRPVTVPDESNAESLSSNSDQGPPSRQTSEASDESGQL